MPFFRFFLFLGFNNFNGKNDILSLTVTGATKEYLIVALKIAMTNPSQITIKIGDIKFNIFMNEFNAQVGDVTIKDATIVPGNNTMDCEMHMYSTNQKALGQLLSNYMTGAKVPLSVKGFDGSTDIPSLKGGLSTINLATTMSGITDKLVVNAVVNAGLDAILAKKAQTQVTLYNPLETPFTLLAAKVHITTQGATGTFDVGEIDYTLDPPMTVNPKESAQSANWPVTVLSDIGQLLELLMTPDLKINIQQNVTMTIGGGDGFTGGMYYYQDQVPCKINLDILGLSKGNEGNATSAVPSDVMAKLPDNVLKSLGIEKPEETSAASPAASSPAASSGGDASSGSDAAATPAPSPDNNEKSADDSSKESSGADDSAKESPAAESSSSSSGGDDKGGSWLWPFKL